jgi:hypothetical protein
VSDVTRGSPWSRIIAEALLIFGSVYVAIFLDGRAQDRRETREATEALGQLLLEVRQDRADLGDIQEAQEGLSIHYAAILRWLDEPSGIPGDSMTASLRSLEIENRTLFPRKGSWNTMVAAGQLPDLEAPELVTLLGNLYENVIPRLEYNGRYYDTDLSTAFTLVIAGTWDSANDRFGPAGDFEFVRMRQTVNRLHVGWNLYYLNLLDEYGVLLEQAVAAVETYLNEHGIELNGDRG